MNNKKVLENVKKVELLEDAAYNLWYKAWAYVKDNTLLVGRYTDVLKGRTRADVFKLGFGLYTNKAHKSTGLQNLFSVTGKEIDENNNVVKKKISKKVIKKALELRESEIENHFCRDFSSYNEDESFMIAYRAIFDLQNELQGYEILDKYGYCTFKDYTKKQKIDIIYNYINK
jgi:hypothetical protein